MELLMLNLDSSVKPDNNT